LNDIIERQQQENEIQLLPIRLSHILELDRLPLHHRDPFDRLLIAQARLEGLTLISHDSIITQYPVQVLW
jgi:PIN domain nuclease of toxin-antitoxin system